MVVTCLHFPSKGLTNLIIKLGILKTRCFFSSGKSGRNSRTHTWRLRSKNRRVGEKKGVEGGGEKVKERGRKSFLLANI